MSEDDVTLYWCCHSLPYPGQERGHPGVDPWVSRYGAASSVSPADNTDLAELSVLTHYGQRAPTVSPAGVPASRPGTDHVLRDLVISVTPGTGRVGDRVDPRLLQCVGLGTCGVQSPPASHHGAHVVVVLGGVRQTDGLDN